MPIRVDPRLTTLIIIAALGLILLACSSPAPTPTPVPPTPTAMPPTPTAMQPTATAMPPTPAPVAPTQPPEPPAPTPTEATSASTDAQDEEADQPEVLTFNLVEGQNEARYLAEEQLARIGFNVAVGKTSDVTGTIAIRTDGTIVADQSKIVVDLRTLTSDSDRRDGFIQGRTLRTAEFPHAELVLTEAKGLSDPLPNSGDVQFQLIGDLTVRGVAKPTTWDVEAEITGNELIGTAVTKVTITGFGMDLPLVGSVLSIEDEIDLEIDFRAALVDG